MMTTVGMEPRERTIWRATWVYTAYKVQQDAWRESADLSAGGSAYDDVRSDCKDSKGIFAYLLSRRQRQAK
jgi:hypothetical protein